MLETIIRNQHLKNITSAANNISDEISFICKIIICNRIKSTVSEEKCSWDKSWDYILQEGI